MRGLRKNKIFNTGDADGHRGRSKAAVARTRSPGVEAVVVSLGDDFAVADGDAPPLKKKTRRGSRGGRNRKKKPTIHVPGDDLDHPAGARPTEPAQPVEDPVEEPVAEEPESGTAMEEEPAVNGDEPAVPLKKKTRRGSRGGKNRRKPVAREDGAAQNGDAPAGAGGPDANGGANFRT